MANSSEEPVSTGELSRQVRDVFARFEGLARRLEDGQFVRTELYVLYRETVDHAIKALETSVTSLESSSASKSDVSRLVDKAKELDTDKVDKTSHEALALRVSGLEDDRKWLVRLVIGFIILGILGAVFAVTAIKP